MLLSKIAFSLTLPYHLKAQKNMLTLVHAIYLNVILVLLITFISSAGLIAQQNTPPPQGPNECENETNSDGGIATILLKPILEGKIQAKIDAFNNDDNKESKVRWKRAEKSKVYNPYVQKTEYRSQPNQNYIVIPFLVELEVCNSWIPIFERTITFTVNIKLFCQNWQHGKGRVQMKSKLTDPIVSGGSLSENVIDFFSGSNLSTYINNEIQKELNFKSDFQFGFGNSSCDCFYVQKLSGQSEWNVGWNKKSSNQWKPIVYAYGGKIAKVDFKEIIRHKGIRPTANIEEDVIFDIWINGKYFKYPSRSQDKIVMKEGDKHSIDNFSHILSVENEVATLQIIAVAKKRKAGSNGNRNRSTSGWTEFKKANKYGHGNRYVQTQMQIISPPNKFNPKPSSQWVKNYELKFNVEYYDPSNQVTSPVGTGSSATGQNSGMEYKKIKKGKNY